MPPGVLPCHACGQPVFSQAATCPSCGARPLYDGLQLIVTAVLVAVAAVAAHVWLHFRKVELSGLGQFLPLGLAIAVIWPPVKFVFAKLKRGRW